MISLAECRLLYFDWFLRRPLQDRGCGMGTEIDSHPHFFHGFITVLYSPGPLSH
jgi:hypothetical protein